MLTIFTIPKSFKGHINIIQRNAIKSWKEIQPKCEIILFGDDEGVADTARELKVKNIQSIDKNKFGTPLLSSAFHIAQERAANDILIYINADIILLQEIIDVIKNINLSSYLICGRRWNININEEIDFNSFQWFLKLLDRVKKEGKLYNYSGKDYFIFKRYTVKMLPFAVGRPYWDDWMLYHMRSQSIPIIDATQSINAIHQNHDYSHSKYGEKTRVGGPELKENVLQGNGLINIISLRDADWIIKDKIIACPPMPFRLYNILSYFFIWRLLLACKRRLHYMFARMFYSKNAIKS